MNRSLTPGRALIEATCNHLKIRKTELSKRIDLLYEKGFLSLNESKRLHSIRFIGNDALHEIEKPKVEQLYIIMEIVNHLLENLFIQDFKIENKIDKVIDNYEDFFNLIRKKITKLLIGKDPTLNEVLGKSVRSIRSKELRKTFETSLINQINNGKIDFLSIVNKENKLLYKIEKLPSYVF